MNRNYRDENYDPIPDCFVDDFTEEILRAAAAQIVLVMRSASQKIIAGTRIAGSGHASTCGENRFRRVLVVDRIDPWATPAGRPSCIDPWATPAGLPSCNRERALRLLKPRALGSTRPFLRYVTLLNFTLQAIVNMSTALLPVLPIFNLRGRPRSARIERINRYRWGERNRAPVTAH